MTAQTGTSLASSPCSQLCLCYRTLVKRCEQMRYGQLWPCWLKSKSLALEFCSFSLLTNCKYFYRVNLEATCWERQSSSQVPKWPHWGQPSTYLECCLGPYTLELLIKPLMNMSLSLFLIITFHIISLHFLILNCIVSYLVLFGVILFCSSFSACFLAVKQEGDPKMWLLLLPFPHQHSCCGRWRSPHAAPAAMSVGCHQLRAALSPGFGSQTDVSTCGRLRAPSSIQQSMMSDMR